MAFEAEKLAHEDAEVRTRRVLAFVFGFVAFVAVLMVALGFFYRSAVRTGSLETRFRDFPAPRLQLNASQDYANFMKSQRDQLIGDSPVDQAGAPKKLSIERAMAAIVARGAAAYDPLDKAGKAPATPQDGAARAVPGASVAPYGAQP